MGIGGIIILLTTAANDKDLVKAFSQTYPGLSKAAPIQHGDFMWDTPMGWSLRKDSIEVPDWDRKANTFADSTTIVDWTGPISVCGDRKKIQDLLQCIEDGRHINQVRSAHEAGFERQFLILEGSLREGEDDSVKLSKRARPTELSYSHVKAYLNQLHHLMGVQVIRTKNLPETVREVFDLYTMYQTPPENHSSLHKFYTAPLPSVMMKPSLIRRTAKELAYIGWDRSLEVEKRFKTIQEMANAPMEDWLSIPGMGKTIAHSVVQELQEEN